MEKHWTYDMDFEILGRLLWWKQSDFITGSKLLPRTEGKETILCRRQNTVLRYSGKTENGNCLNIHCQENVL